ncbi:hypothetical protein DFH07DRAFT_1063617 [Mycena maculata]|uniref:Uncharacterized protein n=1 Tax=Mycena maculata TaxID=230809 RepID=A0AAD7IIB0_9AGAR|nr:hypothetical protein DFH07DRAFT_1063617 [Mycena maculata]
MSTSARKDRCFAMGIHKVPAHLSKEEFERQIQALVDALVAVPVVQANLLKVEILLQNNELDSHLKALGFPEPGPTVVCAVEYASEEHFVYIVQNTEVQKLLAGAQEFGYHEEANVFSADVVTKIDTYTPKDRVHIICICKVPPKMSKERFSQKMEAFMDRTLTHPMVERNVLKYTMWVQNNIIKDHVQALAFPVPEPTVVVRVESENWGRFMELVQDPDFQLIFADTMQDFPFHIGGCCFSADVVTKIDED